MCIDVNTTNIIIAAITAVGSALGGALIGIKIQKSRVKTVTQSDIRVKGKKNKVIGSDDNSGK